MKNEGTDTMIENASQGLDLAALLAAIGLAPRHRTEEQLGWGRAIAAAIRNLREEYQDDAAKIAVVAQGVADTATRIADGSGGDSRATWERAKAYIEQIRDENEEAGVTAYTGTLNPPEALRAALEGAEGRMLNATEIGELVAFGVPAAIKYLEHAFGGGTQLLVAVALASFHEASAAHFLKVHVEAEEAEAQTQAFVTAIEEAKRLGREMARAEHSDCESNEAAVVAEGAAQA